jgi:hypothetical protein
MTCRVGWGSSTLDSEHPPQEPDLLRLSLTPRSKIANYYHAREHAHLFDQHLGLFSGQDGLSIASRPSSSKESYPQLVAQQINLLPIKFEVGLHVPEKESVC